MREIKFRGKKTDGGKWIYGNVLNTEHCGVFISPELAPCTPVNPETVGQFTGFLDKNGKEIYEGDILRVDAGYNIHHTHVVFDIERGSWHRIQDYSISEMVGNIHDNSEMIGEK